ncbi:hypothetical protein BC937DRAFT_90172 [Endogone sp. FLAS-F59071]|nr:hypothetical protein BC937DRAFT_90172 [Endogone sp. FLAS-F59071]|eukprot:RUS17277.1 hypothetical protein BC937DRAFT_90172 [Endogone sp. FLAS-F59071]
MPYRDEPAQISSSSSSKNTVEVYRTGRTFVWRIRSSFSASRDLTKRRNRARVSSIDSGGLSVRRTGPRSGSAAAASAVHKTAPGMVRSSSPALRGRSVLTPRPVSGKSSSARCARPLAPLASSQACSCITWGLILYKEQRMVTVFSMAPAVK